MKLLLLMLFAPTLFASDCPELIARLINPLKQKSISLSRTLNDASYNYMRHYFAGENAALLPLPINHTPYHPKKLAKELFGSAKKMLKELEIDPKLTPKKWKYYMDQEYIKARWMVRGDGSVISWSLDETNLIYEATSKRLSEVLNITINKVKELGNTRMMPIPGGHQDMLSLLSREYEKKHDVLAWGYFTFENGKVSVGVDSYFEKGQDQLFIVLEYLKAYLGK